MVTPNVSIIIPVYNRSRFLAECLNSVLKQTYEQWECLVIDDGSTDNSKDIITQFVLKDARFRLLDNACRKGAPGARNTGISQAKGAYLIFLDSDDILAPFCLAQRVVQFQAYPEADFLVFQQVIFSDQNRDELYLWNVDKTDNDIARFLALDALWCISGPIYKREVIERLGGFKEDLPFWQDYDLHLKCLLNNLTYKKFLGLPPDGFIRKHNEESVSRSLAFTDDKKTLSKRVQFYIYQLDYINLHKIELCELARKRLIDISFGFSSRLALEHKDNRLFLHYWLLTCQKLKTGYYFYAVSVLYVYTYMIGVKMRPFFKMRKWLEKHFEHLLPDLFILDKRNSMFSQEYKSKVSIS